MKYDMLFQKTVERVWKVNPTVQLLDAEFTDEGYRRTRDRADSY